MTFWHIRLPGGVCNSKTIHNLDLILSEMKLDTKETLNCKNLLFAKNADSSLWEKHDELRDFHMV